MHIPAIVKRVSNRNALLTFVVLVFSVLLIVVPSGFQSPFVQNVERPRGKVLEVDNSLIQQFGIVKTGSQSLRVQILDGPYAGTEVDAGNDLIGKMETDKMFRPGDIAFMVLTTDGDRVTQATAYDHYRLNTELLLVLLFAAFLIAFAGWSGVRALLSFVFAVLLLWKILFPSILLGRDPVLIAFFIVMALAAATLTLVAGVNRLALVAFLGALLGIVLTYFLSLSLLPAFHLHGAILSFSETLLYSGFEHLNLTRVFLAAILIGASGAVIDVAIDISTAMHEVTTKRPDLSRGELIKSGFAVGRNMTSTMVTTLLMAYASGYLALLMIFMAQGIPPLYLLNSNYVAAEILKTIVGSFGLVTVAPFTALVGGFIFIQRRHHVEAEDIEGSNLVQDKRQSV